MGLSIGLRNTQWFIGHSFFLIMIAMGRLCTDRTCGVMENTYQGEACEQTANHILIFFIDIVRCVLLGRRGALLPASANPGLATALPEDVFIHRGSILTAGISTLSTSKRARSMLSTLVEPRGHAYSNGLQRVAYIGFRWRIA